MALKDIQVRQAPAKEKPYSLVDYNGLYLFVAVNGTKSWHFRFRWRKKSERISFGTYPEMGLKEAREQRDKARECIAKGIDPRNHRKDEAVNGSLTFKEFAAEWEVRKLKKLGSRPSKELKHGGRQGVQVQIERYMRLDILPKIGHKALKDVTRADLLAIQEGIEKRKAFSITEKVRGWLNEIFRSAVAMSLIDSNPAADLDVIAIPYRRNNHHPHLEVSEMPELMGKIHNTKATRQTELGLRLLLLTAVRTVELRYAEPHHFDLDAALWRIPAENVKQLQRVAIEKDSKVPDYIIPLSHQALEIINELFSYKIPGQRYLLPGRSDLTRPVSENTLNRSLISMGFKGRLNGHGIRGTISTALNEFGYEKDWVEAQLSHKSTNKDRAAYNHAKYIEQRREMMQKWADLLDQWEKEGLAGASAA